ncbi:MAG TPA: ATP-binding cassette domain-containing protein [Acidimicrobiales bacterium]|nr:ATP-binding cassette domain-containing protein [Acidimicrobiales bacterium]
MTTAPWRQDGDIVLRITGVVVRFGGLTAVDVDEMLIPSGAIVGIVGANGAGKTTLFDVLSGFVEPQQGSVVLDGATELIGMKPELRAQRGLGRSFQNATLFESMTVAETLAVAFHTHLPNASLFGAALGSRRLAERGVAAKVDELVELMGLASFYDKFIHELSTGSRRIVDLACVLAHRPRVLLLDEPSSGIAQREVEALGNLLVRVKEALGCTFVVIEHDIPLIRTLSDAMYGMETGRVIARGTPDEVLNDHRVIEAYLGTDPTTISRSGAIGGGR